MHLKQVLSPLQELSWLNFTSRAMREFSWHQQLLALIFAQVCIHNLLLLLLDFKILKPFGQQPL